MLDALSSFDAVTLATFLAASAALWITPGADMMFVLASAASGGPRTGLAAALGINLGIVVHVIVAATGAAALILAWPGAYDALRYGGAAYLVWLAWRAWRAPVEIDAARGATRFRQAVARGFLTNLLNPKILLFILAFLPQFADPARGPIWAQIAALGALFVLGGGLFIALLGALAGTFAARLRRAGRAMNRLSAIVFGGLAARLVLD